MNIEVEIFKKCIFDFDKLKTYGFKKINEVFLLEKNLSLMNKSADELFK